MGHLPVDGARAVALAVHPALDDLEWTKATGDGRACGLLCSALGVAGRCDVQEDHAAVALMALSSFIDRVRLSPASCATMTLCPGGHGVAGRDLGLGTGQITHGLLGVLPQRRGELVAVLLDLGPVGNAVTAFGVGVVVAGRRVGARLRQRQVDAVVLHTGLHHSRQGREGRGAGGRLHPEAGTPHPGSIDRSLM
ncbi:hypothetical protein AB0H94_11205 [Streptomyces purpurascens]|uniref:hypothetical protein n=1 Tax=Streptomyces purpurascens TaxID=1924 RepID=UPI00340BF3BB